MDAQEQPPDVSHLLTKQEGLVIGAGGEGVAYGGSEDWHTPRGFMKGAFSAQDIQDERQQRAHLDNLLIPTGWLRSRGESSQTIRMVLSSIDPETNQTVEDPKFVVGDLDEKTGELRNAEDVSDEVYRFFQEDNAIDLHLRREGPKDPERGGSGNPEGGY